MLSVSSTLRKLSAGAGVPLMAAGGGAGAITVWNLETRRLQTVVRDAHDAPLLSLHFFPGEPRLMSSAGDNSLKQVRSWPTRGLPSLFQLMVPDASLTQRGLFFCLPGVCVRDERALLSHCVLAVWVHLLSLGPRWLCYTIPDASSAILSQQWHSRAQWLFDNSDGSARLLRFRAGHSAPPGLVQYYGNGNRLLSAGKGFSARVHTGLGSGKHHLYINSVTVSHNHMRLRCIHSLLRAAGSCRPGRLSQHACIEFCQASVRTFMNPSLLF